MKTKYFIERKLVTCDSDIYNNIYLCKSISNNRYLFLYYEKYIYVYDIDNLKYCEKITVNDDIECIYFDHNYSEQILKNNLQSIFSSYVEKYDLLLLHKKTNESRIKFTEYGTCVYDKIYRNVTGELLYTIPFERMSELYFIDIFDQYIIFLEIPMTFFSSISIYNCKKNHVTRIFDKDKCKIFNEDNKYLYILNNKQNHASLTVLDKELNEVLIMPKNEKEYYTNIQMDTKSKNHLQVDFNKTLESEDTLFIKNGQIYILEMYIYNNFTKIDQYYVFQNNKIIAVNDYEISLLELPSTFADVSLIINKCSPQLKNIVITIFFCHKYNNAFNLLPKEMLLKILLELIKFD